MPRHVALAALVTIALAAPAALAGIPADGSALGTYPASARVGGALIHVELDRGVVMTGGRVKLSLVGEADTPRKVAVEVRVIRDNWQLPGLPRKAPSEVTRRRVTVEATPDGGKPTELNFDLHVLDAKPGNMDWFHIEVLAAGKSRLGPDDEPDSGTEVGVAVWAGNSLAMTVEEPARVSSQSSSILVTVRVKNTLKQPIRHVSIEVGGPTLGYNKAEGVFVGVPENHEVRAVPRPDSEAPLAPGEERVYDFRVTPKTGIGPGLIVMAEVALPIDESKGKYSYYRAIDAISLARAQPAAKAR